MRESAPPPSDWPLSIFAMGVTAAAFVPFTLIGIDAHHDGIVLKPALDVLNGQQLFRDTFSQYGAGLPYLQAAWLWVFGPTLAALRVQALLAYVLTAGVLVAAWRFLLPRSLVLVALLMWIALPGFYRPKFLLWPWSSAYALLFQAVALYGLLRALAGVHPKAWGAVSGMACAAAFSCRQPVGALTGVAVAAAFGWAMWASPEPRSARAGAIGYVAGASVSLAAGFGMLWLRGSLGDWYLQTVVWPRRWAFTSVGASAWQLSADTWLRPLIRRSLPWVGVAALALIPLRWLGARANYSEWLTYAVLVSGAVGLTAYGTRAHVPFHWIAIAAPIAILLYVLTCVSSRMLRGRMTDARDVLAAAASCVAIVSWHQIYPVPCPMHVWWALAPSLGVALYAAWRASGRHVVATALVTLVLGTSLMANQAAHAWQKATGRYTRLEGVPVIEGMRVPARDAPGWNAFIDAVRSALRENANAPMLVEGRDAFFAAVVRNLRNPGPMYIRWSAMGVDDDAIRAAFIAKEHPLVYEQTEPSPAVRTAMKHVGYRLAFRGRSGSLFVPDVPARADLTERHTGRSSP